ncbi:DNA recombination protein RmuC [Prevotella sp.]|uniref:DNA recombination protein RmuC n=1 Tax=Prevotella sp. TaxID=59823 RepID=UPI003FD738FE
MVAYISIAIAVAIIMVVVGFSLGNKSKGNQQDSAELINNLHSQVAELNEKVKAHETTISNQAEQIKTLTSERDVQKTHADNFNSMLATQKESYEKLLNSQKEDADNAINTERNRNAKREEELKATFDKQMADFKASYEKQIEEIKQEAKSHLQKQEADAEEYRRTETQRNAEAIANMKQAYETQIAELKDSHDKQLAQAKDGAEKQIEALKLMNKEQVDNQLKLIKEQMQTTSEEILKRRQEELGERNKEQVSKIIDPLQQCIKDMQEAFDKTKEQQSEALTRLDETIKINMQKSAALGETADRLTRALTGEVKVQGNFGELKLKQLLEDLELKEGEQFDTQETLRDKTGKTAKGDDGRGLIPDFILHFPNNRHVVVDSKMSLTDYERYMNAEDGTPEKTEYLKSHITSMRAQVKRLAKKEYTKYLPNGYNKLNFAIMYVPIEGALNLALLNDNTLWREAYDQGVMILGPQTMYMNLRVLEMMWTQVRQLKNQQAMMDAANTIIDRVQDFGIRFMDVESSMNDTIKKISKLKITTADSGASIITAAKKLLKAGAQENKKKKSLADMDDSIFIESDTQQMLPETSGNNSQASDTATEEK